MKTSIISTLFLFLSLLTYTVKAQDSDDTDDSDDVSNEVQTRTELELSLKASDKIKLTFMPQLRFDEDLSLSKYLFEIGAEYEALDFLELGTSYRFIVNPRDTKSTEYFNRYSFSATAKKTYGDFEPAIRLRYSNYADDDVDDETFMRYKASVKYDIPKCKITPSLGTELFQQLNGDGLYKVRYSAGFDYKLAKKNRINFSYKFDYYETEYINKHIFTLGYKLKF